MIRKIIPSTLIGRSIIIIFVPLIIIVLLTSFIFYQCFCRCSCNCLMSVLVYAYVLIWLALFGYLEILRIFFEYLYIFRYLELFGMFKCLEYLEYLNIWTCCKGWDHWQKLKYSKNTLIFSKGYTWIFLRKVSKKEKP